MKLKIYRKRVIAFVILFCVASAVFDIPANIAAGDPTVTFYLDNGNSAWWEGDPDPITTQAGTALGDKMPTSPRFQDKDFLGWYVDTVRDEEWTEGENTLFTKETTVTTNTWVVAKWGVSANADLQAMKLEAFGADGGATDAPELTQADYQTPQDFDKDITEYYVIAPENIASLTLKLETYHPNIKAKLSKVGVDITATIAKTTDEYGAEKYAEITAENIVVTDITEEKNYDELSITITAPDGQATKTYKIYFCKPKALIATLNPGNSPFGLIMQDQMILAGEKETAKKSFVDGNMQFNTWLPQGASKSVVYNPLAWGTGAQNNYDKDDFAIFAYTGECFTDPGFSLRNSLGQPVTINAETTVKREITYIKMAGYGMSALNDAGIEQTHRSVINGTAGENVIDFTRNDKVRPGKYEIVYTYEDHIAGSFQFMRNLIILPKKGDINLDGAVNSEDVALLEPSARENLLDENTADKEQLGRILKYRVYDMDYNGEVDNNDFSQLQQRLNILIRNKLTPLQQYYASSYSIPEQRQTEYTKPQETTGLAKLAMSYLGKNSNEILNGSWQNLPKTETIPVEAQDKVQAGDVFWVGVSIQGAENLASFKDIYSMGLQLEYNNKYIEPAFVLTATELQGLASNMEKWAKTVEKYNIDTANAANDTVWGSAYKISGGNIFAGLINDHPSKAKTMVGGVAENQSTVGFEIIAKNGATAENYRSLTGEGEHYIFKLPFKMKRLPESGEKVFGMALGMESFYVSPGPAGQKAGASFDNLDAMQDENNLKTGLYFDGDLQIPVGEKPARAKLTDGVYKGMYNITVSAFNKGDLVGSLPPGLKYNKALNQITNISSSEIPNTVGVYEFSIDGIEYSIEIKKAPLTVTINDAEKTYGDGNPALSAIYTGWCKGDTMENQKSAGGFVEPTITCDAQDNTPITATEKLEIVAADGQSNNYTLNYVQGKLTINKRTLNITELTGGVPTISSDASSSLEVLAEAIIGGEADTARADALSGDMLRLTYKAIYRDKIIATNKAVQLSDFGIDTEYGAGANYSLNEASAPTQAYIGTVEQALIERIEVAQQPRLEYVYGTPLDLSEMQVNIHYNLGVPSRCNIPYASFSQHGIVLSYSQNKTASNGDKIDVSKNGKSIIISTLPSNTVGGVAQTAATASLVVDKKALRIEKIDVKPRDYNGTMTAEGTISVSGQAYEDIPKVTAVFTYDSADAGKEKPVNVTNITLIGVYESNYTIADTATASGTVNKKRIAITEVVADDKVYDNSRDATGTITVGTSVLNEVIAAEGTFAFEDSTAGTDKTVSVTNIKLTEGWDANYAVAEAAQTKATITKQPLKISGAAVETKPYDGTKAANGTLTLSGAVAGENPVATGVFIFSDENMGQAIPVNVTDIKLTGNWGKNYTLQTTYQATGTIDKIMLFVERAEITPKEYDGTKTATGTLILGGMLKGENPVATGVFEYENDVAKDNINVKISNITLQTSPVDWSVNYKINSEDVAIGQIKRAKITPPALEQSAVTISAETNTIFVEPPSMTGLALQGGAVHQFGIREKSSEAEYTWTDVPEFGQLLQDTEYEVALGYKESANFSASDGGVPAVIKTFKNKIILMPNKKTTDIDLNVPLKVLYTNMEQLGEIEEMDSLFENEEPQIFFGYYEDEEAARTITFPYTLKPETVIFTELEERSIFFETQKFTLSHSDIKAVLGDAPIKVNILTEQANALFTKNIKWKSSNEAVAKVTQNGEITFVGVGKAEIMASLNTFNTKTVNVSVEENTKSYGLIDPTFDKPFTAGFPDGSFAPEKSITRAEIAHMLAKLIKAPQGEKLAVSDVAEGSWYYESVQTLCASGVASGYADGTFKPGGAVTRAEMAAMICRLLQLESGADETSPFKDLQPNFWANEYICTLVRKGILSGYMDGSFRPQQQITRAEMVTIVNRIMPKCQLPPGENIIMPTDVTPEHWAYEEIIKSMNARNLLQDESVKVD